MRVFRFLDAQTFSPYIFCAGENFIIGVAVGIFNRFFRKSKKQPNEKPAQTPQSNRIDPLDNPWGIELLDVRPITQEALLFTKDPNVAANVGAFSPTDGPSFLDQVSDIKTEAEANIYFRVDPKLFPGALYLPQEMEHKWAIYFCHDLLLFIQSWERRLKVIAEVEQDDGWLHVTKIRGQLDQSHDSRLTREIVRFLLISHVIGLHHPAPLPAAARSEQLGPGAIAMGLFGNFAHFASFAKPFPASILPPLRSISLLHAAALRADLDGIRKLAAKGLPLDLQEPRGMTPVHFALIPSDTSALELFLELGASPDTRTRFGSTLLMEAAGMNKEEHAKLIISSGANINAGDENGFTALHRSAIGGHIGIVKLLLDSGADIEASAQGHTPLSIAKKEGHEEIIKLLDGN